MKIRAHCTFTGTRPPRDDLRLRDVTGVTARVNWVAEEVELIFQSEGSSTLVRMSAESAKSLGMRLIEESDSLLLALRREFEQERCKGAGARPSRAVNRSFDDVDIRTVLGDSKT